MRIGRGAEPDRVADGEIEPLGERPLDGQSRRLRGWGRRWASASARQNRELTFKRFTTRARRTRSGTKDSNYGPRDCAQGDIGSRRNGCSKLR